MANLPIKRMSVRAARRPPTPKRKPARLTSEQARAGGRSSQKPRAR
jgi:hypothetical protein